MFGLENDTNIKQSTSHILISLIFMIKILILALVLGTALCTLGIDLSTLTSVESFKCFLNSNHNFVSLRAWHSYGGFDVNAPQTIVNAHSAGYNQSEIGVYMFPCFSAQKPAASQIQQMVGNLTNSRYSSIWIDMQTNTSPGCGWGTDYDANCQFTVELVNQAKKSGKKIGIYASQYMWTKIMGGTSKCTKFMSLPLWYAHYDGVPSFTDFKSFGGWSAPSIKQFKGTTAMCSASVDLNYRS